MVGNNTTPNTVSTQADRAAHLKTWSKSLRLEGYDYTTAGLYFITICCKDKTPFFSDEKYARTTWRVFEGYFNELIVAAVLMLDHIHLVINLIGSSLFGVGSDE
jgi:hypothetical protein